MKSFRGPWAHARAPAMMRAARHARGRGHRSRMWRSGVQNEQWSSGRASESRGREAKRKPADQMVDGRGKDGRAFTRGMAAGAQPLDSRPVDEAAQPEIEEGAQLDELVHAHLALPVQDMPEPLAIHADAACEFGYPDASVLSLRLNEGGYLPTYCYGHRPQLSEARAIAARASFLSPIAGDTRSR